MTLSHMMHPDHIRTLFAEAMSRMYQQEVPQYATLVQLVAKVNQDTLAANPQLAQQLATRHEQARLNGERHGAIRVGSAAELSMLRRMFALMGMIPVSYYDLSTAGVPVHSTAFRPIDDSALQHNPFRIFTSLLRLELIADPALRAQAATLLAQRDIFSAQARQLISQAEAQGGLTNHQARQFVREILTTFRWQHRARVDLATYQAMHQVHPLVADVVCFAGPHINHLTPRTLDIDAVQAQMPALGITPKAVIEGPPRRRCPLLLRQTSFNALAEPIRFSDNSVGTHTARFGEIEQRGMALTPKGRALYDALLARARLASTGQSNQAHQRQLAEVFSAFPDDECQLRQQGLGYFRYQITETGRQQAAQAHKQDIEALIAQGWVSATPITYEDFLPVSAAGIFQSNLGAQANLGLQSISAADLADKHPAPSASRADFEAALGCALVDEFSLYAKQQADSLAQVQTTLCQLGK